MGTPYLAEIRAVSFNFPPRGWAFCNGQLLPINQNTALFALLGTTYGGDGQTNFGLPNLQGRVPMHFGNGITQGQRGGEQEHTLSVTELPAHSHTVGAMTAAASLPSPAGARHAATSTTNFAPAGGTAAPLDPSAFLAAGGGQPHDNMQPYLVINFVIALQGIFPSRN
jgi:microcystin-dependent protein